MMTKRIKNSSNGSSNVVKGERFICRCFIVITIIEDSNTALPAVCMNFRKAEDTIKLLKTILLNARCDTVFGSFGKVH